MPISDKSKKLYQRTTADTELPPDIGGVDRWDALKTGVKDGIFYNALPFTDEDKKGEVRAWRNALEDEFPFTYGAGEILGATTTTLGGLATAKLGATVAGVRVAAPLVQRGVQWVASNPFKSALGFSVGDELVRENVQRTQEGTPITPGTITGDTAIGMTGALVGDLAVKGVKQGVDKVGSGINLVKKQFSKGDDAAKKYTKADGTEEVVSGTMHKALTNLTRLFDGDPELQKKLRGLLPVIKRYGLNPARLDANVRDMFERILANTDEETITLANAGDKAAIDRLEKSFTASLNNEIQINEIQIKQNQLYNRLEETNADALAKAEGVLTETGENILSKTDVDYNAGKLNELAASEIDALRGSTMAQIRGDIVAKGNPNLGSNPEFVDDMTNALGAFEDGLADELIPNAMRSDIHSLLERSTQGDITLSDFFDLRRALGNHVNTRGGTYPALVTLDKSVKEIFAKYAPDINSKIKLYADNINILNTLANKDLLNVSAKEFDNVYNQAVEVMGEAKVRPIVKSTIDQTIRETVRPDKIVDVSKLQRALDGKYANLGDSFKRPLQRAINKQLKANGEHANLVKQMRQNAASVVNKFAKSDDPIKGFDDILFKTPGRSAGQVLDDFVQNSGLERKQVQGLFLENMIRRADEAGKSVQEYLSWKGTGAPKETFLDLARRIMTKGEMEDFFEYDEVRRLLFDAKADPTKLLQPSASEGKMRAIRNGLQSVGLVLFSKFKKAFPAIQTDSGTSIKQASIVSNELGNLPEAWNKGLNKAYVDIFQNPKLFEDVLYSGNPKYVEEVAQKMGWFDAFNEILRLMSIAQVDEPYDKRGE